MSAYRRDFDENRCMSFLIKDDKLFGKYNDICEKVKSSIKNEFDNELAYNEKYLKNKINYFNGKINTYFHNNKIPKEGSRCVCLPINLIDSVFRTGKNYYPWVFLEECKQVVKEKKMTEYITEEVELSFDYNTDEETSNEENSDDKNFIEEN